MITSERSILDDLDQVVEEYIDAREMCDKQQKRMRLYVRRFCEWSSSPEGRSRHGTSDSARISAWLAALAASASKPRPSTVNGHRQAIVSLVRFATPDGIPLPRTDRIRRQRTPEKFNPAYSQEELDALLTVVPKYQPMTHRTYGRGLAGDSIPRYRPDGVPWSVWWEAFLRVGYESGQYLSDMRLWRWSDLGGDGSLTFVRHKTGRLITVLLSEAAIEAARRIGHSELILPWDFEMGSYFPREWRKFATFAGVRSLEPKAIRRSAITHAYVEQGEEAARILAGHRSFETTAKHYIDWSIAKRPSVQPPKLRVGLSTQLSEARPRKLNAFCDAMVNETLPHLPPVVADMVRFQRVTGCTPEEVCILRPCDLDRSGAIWRYTPLSDVAMPGGARRVVDVSGAAQSILADYLKCADKSYCFRPCDSEAGPLGGRHANRKKPHSCGNRSGHNRGRRPKRLFGARYSTASYRRAINRACDRAFPAPDGIKSDSEKLAKMKTAYEHGYDARLRGCYRVLCNPQDDAELRDWQRGWDDADIVERLDSQPGNYQQVSIPQAIDS